MEGTIKHLRVELDGLAQQVSSLQSSRENASAKTSFQLSKMMLGKVLAELGTANPYPESKDPNSQKIEPTADVAPSQEVSQFEETYVSKVKRIRSVADSVCQRLKRLTVDAHPTLDTRENQILYAIFVTEAFVEAEKGMMWLGMELGRIREMEEATK